MGRRTVDTMSGSRRMTRNGLRAHLQQQFAQLPLEIVCAIVTIAARDSISAGNRQWVAQSLAVVCNIFCDAAEPVLVESVCIRRHRNFDNVRPGRFARTKHVYLANPLTWRAEDFPALEALTGNLFDLKCIQRARYDLPPRVTLHSYTDSWNVAGPPSIETLNGVTHLHINYYAPHQCPLELLPTSVTHLVLTLSRRPNTFSDTPWGDENTVKLEHQITRILASSRLHLGRVLVCLSDMQRDNAIRVLAHLRQTFAIPSCDARLWVDDSGGEGLSAEEKELLDPAQTAIWYAGRPLHSQSISP